MIDFDGLIALIFLLLYGGIFWVWKQQRKSVKNLILGTVFYVYIVMLIKYTLFPIYCDFMGENVLLVYNIIPIVNLRKRDLTLSLLNILMFIPFGFLYPSISKAKVNKSIVMAFLLSSIIELLQLLLSALKLSFRTFDINDILFNTLGGIIGIFVFQLSQRWK